MVKELLKIQESTILSFFTSLNDTTNRRIDNLVKDVQDLKNSIEFTQAEVADLRDLRLQIQSKASSLEGSTNTMISSTLKPHINAHTFCGRPTLNVFKRFLKGSFRGLYERSIYERTFLNEPIENHATCIYQMSYPMLIIQRTSFTCIIVYLAVIGNREKTTKTSPCRFPGVYSSICQESRPSSRRYASCYTTNVNFFLD